MNQSVEKYDLNVLKKDLTKIINFLHKFYVKIKKNDFFLAKNLNQIKKMCFLNFLFLKKSQNLAIK